MIGAQVIAGDRVRVLKGVAERKEGTVVGYLVRVDGETASRQYQPTSVEAIPAVPVSTAAPQINERTP